jgi:hypothetical protein
MLEECEVQLGETLSKTIERFTGSVERCAQISEATRKGHPQRPRL